MQVEIVDIVDGDRVVVKSPYGALTGRWQGDMPSVGWQQAVEVDVDGVVLWGQDIRLSDVAVNELKDEGPFVRVSGRVTEFGADDVVVLDLGGTVLMVDTDGDPPLGIVDRYVTIQARAVTLYPYDL
jgi:hypothetical protein